MDFRWRGSKRGRGTWRGGRGSRQASLPPTPAPPLGEILAAIQHDDLDDDAADTHDSTQITKTQYLTSYNWLNGEDHQIIVPGEFAHPAMFIANGYVSQVNPRDGLLFLNLLSFEKTPVSTIGTRMRHDIPHTLWSR